jgi:hypothetical protein
MKEGIGQIVGRRIAAVFLRVRDGQPTGQLLLAFDDDTSYEFDSSTVIHPTAGLWPRAVERTEAYLKKGQLFCCEGWFDVSTGYVVERQYEGEEDLKRDRIRHYMPPAGWKDEEVEAARWARFLNRCFGSP